MAHKLNVSNLSGTIDNEDLRRLFAPYGAVCQAVVICRPETGQSAGYGMVEMESEAQGDAAVAALNGREHCGQTLNVVEALDFIHRSDDAQ